MEVGFTLGASRISSLCKLMGVSFQVKLKTHVTCDALCVTHVLRFDVVSAAHFLQPLTPEWDISESH